MSTTDEFNLTNGGELDGADESTLAGGAAGSDDVDEKALIQMRARMAEMEAEAEKLREMNAHANNGMGSGNGSGADGAAKGEGDAEGSSDAAMGQDMMTEDDKEEVDARSVYVGNVDYGATPEEIQQHFMSCGTINRVTILCDKFTGHPKGYAYVEFADPSLVTNAMAMNESLFRGRLIKVTAKRTNLPGLAARGRGRGRGRGRPYRARGRGRGFRGYY